MFGALMLLDFWKNKEVFNLRCDKNKNMSIKIRTIGGMSCPDKNS